MVTGANGAIGGFVVDALVEGGDDVVAVSRQSPAWLGRHGRRHEGGADPVRWALGDIRDRDRLVELCQAEQVEVIIHLAAILVHSDTQPLLAVETNVTGTLNVAEAAARTGVRRVVYMSSKAVIGAFSGMHGQPDYVEITEDFPPDPFSLYGATKLAAERVGATYHERGPVEFISVRAGTTVGPDKGERHGSTRVISQLVEAALTERPFTIPRGGDQPDDIIYNADVAAGLVALARAERLRHQVYHLSTGQLTTLRDIAAALCQRQPMARIEVGPGFDPFGLGYPGYGLLSSSRVAEDTGFRSRFSFPAWIDDYLDRLRPSRALSGRTL